MKGNPNGTTFLILHGSLVETGKFDPSNMCSTIKLYHGDCGGLLKLVPGWRGAAVTTIHSSVNRTSKIWTIDDKALTDLIDRDSEVLFNLVRRIAYRMILLNEKVFPMFAKWTVSSMR